MNISEKFYKEKIDNLKNTNKHKKTGIINWTSFLLIFKGNIKSANSLLKIIQ